MSSTISPPSPLSERVRALADGDASIIAPTAEALQAEIAALERLAFARSLQVTTNGRFPHWTFERWVSLVTLIAVCIGGIWFAGGKWSTVEGAVTEISDVKTALSGLTADLATLRGEVKSNRASSDRRLDELGLAISDATTEARAAARASSTLAWQIAGRGGRGGRP